jgi:hypothetical protein
VREKERRPSWLDKWLLPCLNWHTYPTYQVFAPFAGRVSSGTLASSGEVVTGRLGGHVNLVVLTIMPYGDFELSLQYLVKSA